MGPEDDYGNTGPTIHLPCSGVGNGEIPPSVLALTACGRWETWSCGHKKVVPAPHQLSIQGSRPCTLHGKHSRADPGGRGTGEPALGRADLPPCLCGTMSWLWLQAFFMSQSQGHETWRACGLSSSDTSRAQIKSFELACPTPTSSTNCWGA